MLKVKEKSIEKRAFQDKNVVQADFYKNDNLVGYVIYDRYHVQGVSKSEPMGEIIEVQNIFVNSEFRNKGYGTYMMEYMQNKNRPIILTVLYDRVHDFYNRLQFIQEQPEGFCYDPKEHPEYHKKIKNKFKKQKAKKTLKM